MARQYHRQSGSAERYKTISFYRSYHGATMGALTQTGWPQLRTPYEPFLTGGVHAHPPMPGACRACAGSCTLGCLAQLRDVIEHEGPRTVSAIIVEPVMLTAGVQPLSQEYLQGLRALCDEHGILLIFDEIVTGFGRLGSWFAAEQVDVWPDILCVGKGLSSGYAPLSAVLLTEKVGRGVLGRGGRRRPVPGGPHLRGEPRLGRVRPRRHPLLRGARRARERPRARSRARGAPARDRGPLPDLR